MRGAPHGAAGTRAGGRARGQRRCCDAGVRRGPFRSEVARGGGQGGPRSQVRGGAALGVVLVLAGLAGALALAWMLLLPGRALEALTWRTTFRADVAALALNPFTGRLHVEGLVLENPAEWGEREFAVLRELHADSAAARLFGRPTREIDRIDVELSRLVLVRQPDGTTNWDAFFAALGRERSSALALVPGREAAPSHSPSGELDAASGPAAAPGSAGLAASKTWRVRELRWRCDAIELVDLRAPGGDAIPGPGGSPLAPAAPAAARRLTLELPVSFTVHDVDRPAAIIAAWDEALRLAGARVSLAAWWQGSDAPLPAVEAAGPEAPAGPAIPPAVAPERPLFTPLPRSRP